jgi:ferric-dicitrate binding protein FerR (iron transport regulator)
MIPKFGLVVALALIAGALGWRAARKRRRSLYDEIPVGMSEAEYERHEKRRVVRRRWGSALSYGAAGALTGWIVALLLRLP